MQASHPTQLQLKVLLAGYLSKAEAAQLERHLADCPACCRRLSETPDDDSVVQMFRALPHNGRGAADHFPPQCG